MKNSILKCPYCDEIQEGEKLKWGYGFCWRNYNRLTSTIAPVPFNLLLRWGREIYFYLAKPKKWLEEEAFREGRKQGIAEMTESILKHQKHFTNKGIQVGWDLFNEMFPYRNLPEKEYYKKVDELKEKLLVD